MEGYIEKTLSNSWPYWHIITLKKLDVKGIVYVYDVDNDVFLSIDEAKEKVSNDDTLMLNENHKLFGKKETLKVIFRNLRDEIFPVIPDNVKENIERNLESDNAVKVLSQQTKKIRSKFVQEEDYITDVSSIMSKLKGIPSDKCFNLSTGNIVNRKGAVIFNNNETIPLCLSNTVKGSSKIFELLEKKIEKVMKVKTKTEILDDEDIEKMNLRKGIPHDFNPDVKRSPSFPIPPDEDIQETMRQYRRHLSSRE